MLLRNRDVLKNTRRGFTLMEILVVVAIIVILAGVGGYYILGAADSARKSAARLNAKTITQAIESYSLQNNGQFPPSLDVLLQKDAAGNGPYLKSIENLIDPWGNKYQSTTPQAGPKNNGLVPDVWCVSPTDGQTYGNWSAKY
jgi:general secretion pathway protein G